jgi:hypothetical protein
MSIDLDGKIKTLSQEDRYKFSFELDQILNDRGSASHYGIVGRDYECLPPEKVKEAKEKLYREMFENKKEE